MAGSARLPSPICRGDAVNPSLGHEVQEPKDAHEEGKPCLICQDTIWSRDDLSRHVSRCLFLSHTPSQDQQTTPDEGTFHFVTYTEFSPVIDKVAPALVVSFAAPPPVIECSALSKIVKSIRTATSRRVARYSKNSEFSK